MSHRTKGFTLIELLVVVAIIVILIAILVPSLERAMASAQRAKCLSNIRLWGTSIKTYSFEHNGAAPDLDAPQEREGEEMDWLGMYPYLFAPYMGEESFLTPDGEQPGYVDVYGPSGGYYADPQINETDPTQSDPNAGIYGDPGVGGDFPRPFHLPLNALLCPSTNVPEQRVNYGAGNANEAWGQFNTWGSYAINMWTMSSDYYWSELGLPANADKYFGRFTNVPGYVPVMAGANWIDTWPQNIEQPFGSVNHRNMQGAMRRIQLARHDVANNLGYADGSASTVPLGELWMQIWHEGGRKNSSYLCAFDKY